MKLMVILSFIVAASGCSSFQNVRDTNTMSTVSTINDNWLYLEMDTESLPTEPDSEYQALSLPHTWNNEDALKAKSYRRGASWYRKYLDFSEAEMKNRLYLRFGAAGQRAVVYVNGKLCLEHVGGYSAFSLELTKLVTVGKNKIDVMVSNKHDKMIAPLSGDFNMYGGLYRSVQLIKAPQVSICRNLRAGPGFRKWSETVSRESADLKIAATIDNGTDKEVRYLLQAVLTSPQGDVVSKGEASTVVKGSETKKVSLSLPEIPHPTLWSPDNPNLYTLTLTLKDGGNTIDVQRADHGFRWFEFTPDKGFFLNGEPCFLKGVNRHQDYETKGNAIGKEHHDLDIDLMKELGVNWLRLAHYQQDDYILDLCDQKGLLVWEEIPYVNGTTFEPQFEKNLRSMMKDMIEQHYNHTSIVLWGIGNEVRMKKRDDGKARCWDIINGLNDLIHDEDPTRKSVFVIGDANYAWQLGVMDIPDVIGYNLYRGWYGAGYESFTARCEDLHSKNPDKPFIVSEFGAGSDQTIHTENPRRYDFSEEYQINFLQSHFDQIEKIDWLAGVNYWNYADFGVAHRGDSIPHVNQKGLVNFKRERKDAFFLTKSRWSAEPVLYIQSPSWIERSGSPAKEYRVFTNLKDVELFHNGKSLGVQHSEFKWKVTLVEGENALMAKSGSMSHGFSLQYKETVAKYLASASHKQDETVCLFDGNNATRWSAEGNTQIDIDLKNRVLVNGVKISFYKSNNRSYKLKIKGSADGKTWSTLFDGKSNISDNTETFEFLEQQEIQYLRIEGAGNNENSWNSYYEIEPIITTKKKVKNQYEKIGPGAL